VGPLLLEKPEGVAAIGPVGFAEDSGLCLAKVRGTMNPIIT
jgi:hypothetical protein